MKKVNTAIQELIEFAEGLWATNPNPRIYHSSIIGKAKSLLDKELTGECLLHNVNQQREWLLAFAKHQRNWGNTTLTKEMHEKEIEHFLKEITTKPLINNEIKAKSLLDKEVNSKHNKLNKK